MVKNNLKIAIRSLWRNKTFSTINLLGFAFGLAAAVAVLLYVQDERSFDVCHARAERIVRVQSLLDDEGGEMRLGTAPNILAPFLAENLPDVEEATRVFANNFTGAANVGAGQKNFAEENFFWADQNVFKVLTFNFLVGKKEDALARPGTVILCKTTAEKYFGEDEPMGKKIRVDNARELEVTGIFEDFPANVQQKFEAVGAFQTVGFGKNENQSWGNASFITYLLLRENSRDVAAVEAKIAKIVAEKRPTDAMPAKFQLKPMPEVHLHSGTMSAWDKENYGDARQVNILAGLAVLLLLIACINYMNLATAQSQQRAREVGLRKTLGANRQQLLLKFYFETALLAALGVAASLVILILCLPFFNELADKNLTLDFLKKGWFWLGIGSIWTVVSLVAGGYPAMFLSSFSPLVAMRQQLSGGFFGGAKFRQGLVIFQFFVSTALIFSTLIFYRQLNFIRSQNLGFEPEQVVAVKISAAENREQIERFQNELTNLPAVASTTRSQTFPGRSGSGRSLGHLADEDGAPLTTCRARPEIFKVLDIKMLAGQPMRVPADGDTITQVVLNRSAAKHLGWSPDEAVGKKIEANLQNAEVVGVVEDFHFGSMHEQIGNYAFHNARTEGLDFQLIRLEKGQIASAMSDIEAAFKRALPNSAFDFIFLDEHLDSLYRREQRIAKVALLFAGLAVFVACLGLFALAAFTVERRQKEIGIRKVLGASVAGVAGLLSADFVKLVVVALVLASPVAYFLMENWLTDFAYRIRIEWWMFVATGILAVAVAGLTVGFQSVRAALANPIESLRSE